MNNIFKYKLKEYLRENSTVVLNERKHTQSAQDRAAARAARAAEEAQAAEKTSSILAKRLAERAATRAAAKTKAAKEKAQAEKEEAEKEEAKKAEEEAQAATTYTDEKQRDNEKTMDLNWDSERAEAANIQPYGSGSTPAGMPVGSTLTRAQTEQQKRFDKYREVISRINPNTGQGITGPIVEEWNLQGGKKNKEYYMNKKDYKNILLEKYYTLSEEDFRQRDRDDIEKRAAAVQAAGISASQDPRRSMESWKQLEAAHDAKRQQDAKMFDNMTYGELDAQYRTARLSETGDKPLSSRFEDSEWGKPYRGLKIKPGSDEHRMRVADLRSWEAQRRDELKRGQEQYLKDHPEFAKELKRLEQERKDQAHSAWKQRNAERINTYQAQISTAERPATQELERYQELWKHAAPRDARPPSAAGPARRADPDFVGPPRGWVEPNATTDQWGNPQPGWISAIGQGGPTTDVYGVRRPDLSVRDQFKPYDPNKNPTGNPWPSTRPAPAPAPAAPAVTPSTPAATPKAPPAATARDGARPAPSVAAFQASKATQPEEDPDAIPPLPPWDSSFRAPLSTATPPDERKRPFPLARPLSRRSSRTNRRLSAGPFIAGRIKPKSPNTKPETLMASYDYFHQTLKNKYSFIREEIVNPQNKGTMTKGEVSGRDQLAKKIKAKAIKRNDTEENARYRLATYITLKDRTEGSSKRTDKLKKRRLKKDNK
jgi:hypothetical protein